MNSQVDNVIVHRWLGWIVWFIVHSKTYTFICFVQNSLSQILIKCVSRNYFVCSLKLNAAHKTYIHLLRKVLNFWFITLFIGGVVRSSSSYLNNCVLILKNKSTRVKHKPLQSSNVRYHHNEIISFQPRKPEIRPFHDLEKDISSNQCDLRLRLSVWWSF